MSEQSSEMAALAEDPPCLGHSVEAGAGDGGNIVGEMVEGGKEVGEGKGKEEEPPAEEPVLCLRHMESVSDEVRRSPGFKFLTRPDLYKFAKVRQLLSIMIIFVE